MRGAAAHSLPASLTLAPPFLPRSVFRLPGLSSYAYTPGFGLLLAGDSTGTVTAFARLLPDDINTRRPLALTRPRNRATALRTSAAVSSRPGTPSPASSPAPAPAAGAPDEAPQQQHPPPSRGRPDDNFVMPLHPCCAPLEPIWRQSLHDGLRCLLLLCIILFLPTSPPPQCLPPPFPVCAHVCSRFSSFQISAAPSRRWRSSGCRASSAVAPMATSFCSTSTDRLTPPSASPNFSGPAVRPRCGSSVSRPSSHLHPAAAVLV